MSEILKATDVKPYITHDGMVGITIFEIPEGATLIEHVAKIEIEPIDYQKCNVLRAKLHVEFCNIDIVLDTVCISSKEE